MYNLNKKILISLLLTVSPPCVMANDTIDSLYVTQLTNTVTLPSGEVHNVPSNTSKKRQRSSECSSSSKKSTTNKVLSAEVGSFTEQLFSLDTIREAVTQKKFNIKKGTENCLKCSLNFIEYIQNEGKVCKSVTVKKDVVFI